MPVVDGKTLIGWSTLRESPWHFVGLFMTQPEAQLTAQKMGDGYVARYGERQETPDTFTSNPPVKFTAIAGSIFVAIPTASDKSTRLDVVARRINGRIAEQRGKRG